MARWEAAVALPARTAHLTAPQAANTQAFGRYSFHDPFHGPMAGTAGTCHGQSPISRLQIGRRWEVSGCHVSTAVREAIRRSGAVVAVWPRITLRVSPALETGLTAAVSRVLTDAGISCTVIAGAAHNQLFVDWLGDIALALLRQL